jgi:hypothetical protein
MRQIIINLFFNPKKWTQHMLGNSHVLALWSGLRRSHLIVFLKFDILTPLFLWLFPAQNKFQVKRNIIKNHTKSHFERKSGVRKSDIVGETKPYAVDQGWSTVFTSGPKYEPKKFRGPNFKVNWAVGRNMEIA